MNYVVAFAFNHDADQLAVIRKIKPDWQRGKLNGIGGKIEPNETPVDAAVREFAEETGVTTWASHWQEFAVIHGYHSERVYFFVAFNDFALDVETRTAEEVSLIDPHRLPSNTLPNLRWLVPAALDLRRGQNAFSYLTIEYNA